MLTRLRTYFYSFAQQNLRRPVLNGWQTLKNAFLFLRHRWFLRYDWQMLSWPPQVLFERALENIDGIALLEFTLDKGANVNRENIYGKSPLQVVLGMSTLSFAWHREANKRRIEIMRLLLEKGATVDKMLRHGETLLFQAIRDRNQPLEAIQLLLDFGADIHYRNTLGSTPLHIAARCGRIEIVRLLLERNANFNLEDNTNDTPIVVAFENAHTNIVHLLQRHGAQLPVRLQAEQRAGGAINGNQSVHEIAVHHFVSDAARNLKAHYQDKDMRLAYQSLSDWIESLENNGTNAVAKRGFAWLNTIKEFTDIRSGVTMVEAMALIWLGVNDKTAQPEITLTDEDILARRQTLLKHLVEIQRGYNLNARGQDNQQHDHKTCVSGSFNKLIATLAGGHQCVHFLYVNKETIARKATVLIDGAFEQLTKEEQSRFAKEWCEDQSMPEVLLGKIGPPIKVALKKEFDELAGMVQNYDAAIKEAVDALQWTNPSKMISALHRREVQKEEERERLQAVPPVILPGFEAQRAQNKMKAVPPARNAPSFFTR